MVGMAGVAKPMIITILTEKWAYSAVLLVPICLSSMWYPVHAINLNLLQVKGRSDLFLKLEIIKKIMGVIVLCISIPFGLYDMCWGTLLTSIRSLIINTHYTGKLIKLGFIKQMLDLAPVLILSLVMGTVVYSTVTFIPFSPVVGLSVGVVEGILFYIIFSKLFRFPEFTEIVSIICRK